MGEGAVQPRQHPPQVFHLQLGTVLVVGHPDRLVLVRTAQLLLAAVVGQVDLGIAPLGTLQPGAVLVTVAGGVDGPGLAGQDATHAIGLDPLVALGPVGLHQAQPRLGDFQVEALHGPEVQQDRPDLLGRCLDGDPARGAVTMDTGLGALGQHVAGAGHPVAVGTRILALPVEIGQALTFLGARQRVAAVGLGRHQIGRHVQAGPAPGIAVLDVVGIERVTQDGAAAQQQERHQQGWPGGPRRAAHGIGHQTRTPEVFRASSTAA